MKKRLISILTATMLALSSLSALADEQYLSEPYTDDFSNVAVSNENWSYAGSLDARDTTLISGVAADKVCVDGGVLKVTTASGSKHAVFKVFEQPIDGNVKITMKVQFPSIGGNPIYMQGSGAVSATDTRAMMQYVAFWLSGGKLMVASPHHNPKNGATVLYEDAQYSADKWYDITLMLYGSEKKYGISFNGGTEHKADISSYMGRFGDNEPYLGLCRIGFFLYENISLNIDDVKVERDIPLVLNSQNIQDGAVNVSADTAIELGFNKLLLNANTITLKYTDENNIEQTVECDIDSSSKKVIITPKDKLLSLETYTLTIPASVEAKDGKKLGADKTITFTTQLVDDLAITDAAFDGNTFTAKINNESSNPITATARLVTYRL
ncbi:MAG: Ig-like domain-containing protein, partial [Clostridia bacterium]|nr:Ig-like domain-containing protein [Clostridia bacterium]